MRKLLVIDDNLGFLGFLTSALEKYFEVYTATGVKDALRLLEHQKVEAICSDYNMREILKTAVMGYTVFSWLDILANSPANE